MNDMTKAARTIFVYSFYLFGMGAAWTYYSLKQERANS